MLIVLAVTACANTSEQSGPDTTSSTMATPAWGAKGTDCHRPDRKDGREPLSLVLGIHHVPSLTRERYEAVIRRLTNGEERLESPSDAGIEGLLVHVTGEGADGFWVIDVWESQEAADRFMKRVRPVALAVGIQEPMKTYAIHTFVQC
jgi:hypothetical protein